MSLIEEALRKQRDETERTKLTLQQPTPPSPPPAPPPETPEAASDAPPRKKWSLLALALIIIVLLLGVGVWLLFFGVKLSTAPSSNPESTVSTAAKAAPLEQPPSTGSVPAVPAGSAAAKVPAPPESPTTPAGLTVEPAATPVPPTPAPATPLATPPAPKTAPVQAPAPEPAAENVKPLVIWPRLAVMGFIGGNSGKKGAVIINGQMLGVGDAIEGATIVAIDKEGAHLTFSGDKRLLKVGGTTGD